MAQEVDNHRKELPQTGDPETREAISEISESEKAIPEAIIKKIENLIGNSAALAEIKEFLEKAIVETDKINQTTGLNQLIQKIVKEEIEGNDFIKTVSEMLEKSKITIFDIPKKIETSSGLTFLIFKDVSSNKIYGHYSQPEIRKKRRA